MSTHVALRTSLTLCQPVNCIFYPIKTLKWLVAASKLHNVRASCFTAESPFIYSTMVYETDRRVKYEFITIISVNKCYLYQSNSWKYFLNLTNKIRKKLCLIANDRLKF